jgi:hypothetical protein
MNARSAVRPAAWAALAECGVVYLPVKLLLEQATQAREGILLWFPSFAALFIAGAVLATRFRESPSTPTVAAVVGVTFGLVQGVLWGVKGPGEVGTAVVAASLVALRVVTLALRDWRNPINASFGWGAGILLVEVVLGGNIGSTWRAILPAVVGLFFVGSLASRAESVRLTAPPQARLTDAEPTGKNGRAVGDRLSVLAVGTLAGTVALMAIMTAGGGLELLGKLLYPVLVFVVSVVAFLMGQIARPLLWLIDRLPIDLGGLVEFLQRLRDGDTNPLPQQPPAAGGGMVPRLLGFLLLVVIVGGLVLIIRRRRAEDDWGSWGTQKEEAPRGTSLQPRARFRPGRALRRELPADTVRRWYAEALMLLEAKGMPRPPDATPDEFLRQVADAFPECRHGFHELTRGYERVRYGNVVFGREDIKALEPRRAHVMEILQRARRLEEAAPAEADR